MEKIWPVETRAWEGMVMYMEAGARQVVHIWNGAALQPIAGKPAPTLTAQCPRLMQHLWELA
ncbi:hypothetical protein, partial [Pseudomonas sp.]|uniref:hypothetical protein n=1 Tax=Pseudomonas sp. TaxID=306 RepID=UPI003C752DC0